MASAGSVTATSVAANERTMSIFTDQIVATPDPAPTGVPNPIHDEAGSTGAGYSGALVAGVRTYGWAVETIVRAIGEEWLATGWVDFSLRRPLFAPELLTIQVTEAQGHWNVICRAGTCREERVVLEGVAGLKDVDWLSELSPPSTPSPLSSPSRGDTPLTSYDLDSVPLRRPLTPLSLHVSNMAASQMVTEDLGIRNNRYTLTADPVTNPVPVHPYFLAGRMAPLTRHNFVYGPTIHVRSQIKHHREPIADQTFTVGAQIVDAYDRKGHWYQVLDGTVVDDQGTLAEIRHHTIFRPRPAT